MRKICSGIAVVAGLVASGTANAQSWGVYVGTGGSYPAQYRYYDGDEGYGRTVCSGEQAHGLEARLRHEVGEGEIDPGQADRIHDSIDRLEDRARHECAEGDYRAIRGIGYRYSQIGRWIDMEAHGRERWGW
jgi:hypothetical protein